jgi:hypothetical protein
MKSIPILIIMFTVQLVFSQTTENTVTLTTSGTGKTLEEAKNNALRSAIEQAFGAFVSSKTEILNDQLVSDQITSVSSGNIQKFEIKNESKLPNGIWCTTLTATVSVDKLISFVQAKGVTVEIKGGLFALNVKQQILNEKAEIESIINAVGNIHDILQKSFNYKIQASEPMAVQNDNNKWSIPLTASVYTNENYNVAMNYLFQILSTISLSDNEVANYLNHGKRIYKVWIQVNGVAKVLSLRKVESIWVLQSLSYNLSHYYTRQFKVTWGTSNYYLGEQFNNTVDQFNERVSHFRLDPLEGRIRYESRGAEGWIEKGIHITFDIPEVNKLVDNFSINHRLTLNELESISEYKIEPIQSVSRFEFGGYVFAEQEFYKANVKINEISYEIEEITKDGPGDLSGLKLGDKVISINGKEFNYNNFNQLMALSTDQNKKSIFEVQRGDSIIQIFLTPNKKKAIFIAAPYTFPEDSLNMAIEITNNLNLNGFSDWILANDYQMRLLRTRLIGFGIINVPQYIFDNNLIGKLNSNQVKSPKVYEWNELYWCSSNSTNNSYSVLQVKLKQYPSTSDFENFETITSNLSQMNYRNISNWKANYIPIRIQILDL